MFAHGLLAQAARRVGGEAREGRGSKATTAAAGATAYSAWRKESFFIPIHISIGEVVSSVNNHYPKEIRSGRSRSVPCRCPAGYLVLATFAASAASTL